MTDIPDPDGIGWSYHIYRSHERGTFVTDIGGFTGSVHDKEYALFRRAGDSAGFTLEGASLESTVFLSADAVRAMHYMLSGGPSGSCNYCGIRCAECSPTEPKGLNIDKDA